jgi:hypothetical protein
MEATAHAVRSYWSDHRYDDEPREAPSTDAIVVPNFPALGDRCSVWFGSVPDKIQEATRIRVAMANVLLDTMVGHATAAGDAGVDEQIDKVPLGFDEHAWYVTMVLDRPVELDDEQLTENRYWWIDPRGSVETAEGTLIAEVPRAFEVVVAMIAPMLQGSMFEGHVRDHFYITAEGRGPVFYPRMTGSATGVVARAMADFPLDAIRKRLAALGEHGEWHQLGNAAHWYEAMLGERTDHLRRFLWGFIALEVLTNELLSHLQRPALEALRKAGTQIPLAARFALVANELSPDTAISDIEIFAELRRARNDLAHGNRRLGDQDPPSEAIRALLPRYFELTVVGISGDQMRRG